jgi:hypothetical protein
MDIEKIREARLAHPFARFTLVLDDGTHWGIEEPYQLAISPGGSEITFGPRGGSFQHAPASRVINLLRGIIKPETGGARA